MSIDGPPTGRAVPPPSSPSLFDRLQDFGDRPALIDECGREWSYRRMVEVADARVGAIAGEGRLVALAASNGIDSLLVYIGARRAGHPVLLMSQDGVSDAELLRRFSVDYISCARADGWALEQVDDRRVAVHPELAVLLATSGSTGTPKFVRLSRTNLDSNALAIAEYLEFTPGERAMTTLPFNYSYGLSVINSHLVTGNCIILNDRSIADPGFWQEFDTACATSFAGVPYSFEMLDRSGFMQSAPPRSLRYFTQAGGKLSPDHVRDFAGFAQRHAVRFFVMYGQTEASPRMTYVPSDLVHSHPGAIGYPIPGGTIELVDEKGEAVDAAVEGELVYRGPNVMMGYARSAEDLARGHELEELRTGDLAVRDALGMVTITGRKNRFVKLFGMRIGLAGIEALLNENGIRSAANGDDRQIRIVIDDGAVADRAVDIVRQRHGLPASAVRAVLVPALPRLLSGKIDYRAVASICADEAVEPPSDTRASLRDEITQTLGETIPPGSSFADASGDSLNYVRVSMLLEEHLGYLPDGWEEIPIDEMCTLPVRESKQAKHSGSLTFLANMRASLMLLGVPYHAAMAYSSNDWIVKANDLSRGATWFADLAHTFRMPAFFFIAGYFAMLLIRSQPPTRWLRERVKALAPPLLIAIFLINPVIMLGRSLGKYSGARLIADWTRQLSTAGPHWIEHAWFLIFLIIYSAGLTIFRQKLSDAPAEGRADAGSIWALASTANLLKFTLGASALVAAAVVSLRANHLNFMFADMLWTSNLVSLLPLFVLGCMTANGRAALDRFAAFDWSSLVVASVSVVALACVQQRSGIFCRGLCYFLVPLAGIFATRLLAYVCRRWLHARSARFTLLVDASMTIYLVHQIFVVFLIDLFNLVALPPFVEIAIISLLAVGVSLGVHLLCRHLLSAITSMAKSSVGEKWGGGLRQRQSRKL